MRSKWQGLLAGAEPYGLALTALVPEVDGHPFSQKWGRGLSAAAIHPNHQPSVVGTQKGHRLHIDPFELTRELIRAARLAQT
jgi:hypothetical protein